MKGHLCASRDDFRFTLLATAVLTLIDFSQAVVGIVFSTEIVSRSKKIFYWFFAKTTVLIFSKDVVWMFH